MELNPILELNTLPKQSMWHVVSAVGDSPSMRVGHTASYIRQDGVVIFVGGANPDGAFAEHYSLNLKSMSWDRVEGPTQLGRYEHAAFVCGTKRARLYVFGGANKSGNINEVVYLDVRSNRWKSLTQLLAGQAPEPRTYHAGQSACSADQLYVFSGGQEGTEAVQDPVVHRLCVSTRSWHQLHCSGQSPGPRQGHAVAVDNEGRQLLVHGGMQQHEFYDTLHSLDLNTCVWSELPASGGVRPCARAGHGAAIWHRQLYVFAGMAAHGALNDLYFFDLDTNQWTQVMYEGDPPQCRLDFALCLCDIEIKPESGDDIEQQQQQQAEQDSMAKSATESQSNQPPAADGSGADATTTAATAETGAAAATAGAVSADSKNNSSSSSNNNSSSNSSNNNSHKRPVYLVTSIMVNGGMDCVGNIFDDTLVFPLAIRQLVDNA